MMDTVMSKVKGRLMQKRWLVGLLFVLAALAGCGDPPAQSWQLTEKGGLIAASLDANAEHVVLGTVMHGGSLWRLSDEARLHDWNHSEENFSLFVATAITADGRLAATAERNSIAAWEVETGRPGGIWKTEGGVRKLALSANGRWLMAGLFDGVATLVDLQQGRSIGRIRHGHVLNAVVLDDEGETAVTGSDDGKVQVWNLADATELHAWEYPSAITAMALAPDGVRLFIARAHGKGEIRDLNSGRILGEIGMDRTTVVSARFSADGRRLLTGLPAGRLILWDVRSGAQLAEWNAPDSDWIRPTIRVPLDVAFDEAGRRVVGVFSDGSVLAWSYR
jgi:WD40 repeat protein